MTSRSELKGFGSPEFAHPYRLIPLNDEDATTLFRHWASLDDGNSGISDKTAKEVCCQTSHVPMLAYFAFLKWNWKRKQKKKLC